jgi:hypothetical protein
MAQKVAQNNFCQSQHILYNFGKSSTKIWTTFVIFEKLSNVNNRPLGENSPNLVTLALNQGVQIGRIFAPGPFFTFGSFFEN